MNWSRFNSLQNSEQIHKIIRHIFPFLAKLQDFGSVALLVPPSVWPGHCVGASSLNIIQKIISPVGECAMCLHHYITACQNICRSLNYVCVGGSDGQLSVIQFTTGRDESRRNGRVFRFRNKTLFGAFQERRKRNNLYYM